MPDAKRMFAYGALLGGGIAGIIIGEGKKVAMIGFALYAVQGTLGFLQILTKNNKIERINRDYVSVFSMALSHGLITTDYCVDSGLDMPKALALNLICPVIFLFVVAYRLKERYNEIVNAVETIRNPTEENIMSFQQYLLKNNDLYFLDDAGHAISCLAMAYFGYDKSQYMAFVTAVLYLIIYFANVGIYETMIVCGLTAAVAGLLLAGKDFTTAFG